MRRIDVGSFLCDEAAGARRRLVNWCAGTTVFGVCVVFFCARGSTSGFGRALQLDRLSSSGWVWVGVAMCVVCAGVWPAAAEWRFRTAVRAVERRRRIPFAFDELPDVLREHPALARSGQSWARIVKALVDRSTGWEGTLLCVDMPIPRAAFAEGEAVELGVRLSTRVVVAAAVAMALGVAAAATAPFWWKNAGAVWLAALGALGCGVLFAALLLNAARRQGAGVAVFSEVTREGVTVGSLFGRARAYGSEGSLILAVGYRRQDVVGSRRLDHALHALEQSREGREPRYVSVWVFGRGSKGALRCEQIVQMRPSTDADVEAAVGLWLSLGAL